MQRRLVVNDVSGQNIGSIFKVQAVPPIGCPETSVTTKLHCVTSKKIEYLIYTAAEARNHAHINSVSKIEHARDLYLGLSNEFFTKMEQNYSNGGNSHVKL